MKQVKPEFLIADDFLDLKLLDTQIIVKHLEEQIRLREAAVEQRIKKLLR